MPNRSAGTQLAAVKSLAAEFIAVEYPEECDFFPLIWEQYETQWKDGCRIALPPPGKAGMPSLLGLGFGGSDTAKLVSPWVILTVGAVLSELNSTGWKPRLTDVQAAIKSSGQALGASGALCDKLAERMGPALLQAVSQAASVHQAGGLLLAESAASENQRKPYAVWTWDGVKQRTQVEHLAESSIETRYYARMNQFDLFVRERECFVRQDGQMMPVHLEDRTHRMFLALLRHKGFAVDVTRLLLIGYQLHQPPMNYSQQEIVEQYLKIPMHQIRTRLAGVKNLRIPRKTPEGGYMCLGKFSHCVVIRRSLAEELKLE